MNEIKKEEKLNLNLPPDLRTIYADEVLLNSPIKIVIEKGEKGEEKVRKYGVIILNFYDNQTKVILAKIAINPLTAKALGKILIDNSNRVLEELDKKEISPEMKKTIEEAKKKTTEGKTTELSYIG